MSNNRAIELIDEDLIKLYKERAWYEKDINSKIGALADVKNRLEDTNSFIRSQEQSRKILSEAT